MPAERAGGAAAFGDVYPKDGSRPAAGANRRIFRRPGPHLNNARCGKGDQFPGRRRPAKGVANRSEKAD